MILRIGRVQVKPGTWDAFERAYREMLDGPRPAGVLARWLAREVGQEDAGFTVGLWESEQAVADWLACEAHAGAQAKMAPFALGDFEVHVAEVLLDDREVASKAAE